MQRPEAAEAGLALAAPALAALVAGPDELEGRVEAAAEVDDALFLEGAGKADDLDAVGRGVGQSQVDGADVGGRVIRERSDISFSGNRARRLTSAVPVSPASQGIAMTRWGIL